MLMLGRSASSTSCRLPDRIAARKARYSGLSGAQKSPAMFDVMLSCEGCSRPSWPTLSDVFFRCVHQDLLNSERLIQSRYLVVTDDGSRLKSPHHRLIMRPSVNSCAVTLQVTVIEVSETESLIAKHAAAARVPTITRILCEIIQHRQMTR